MADCRTLGDHLKRRRLQLGLLQREVAPILGIDLATLGNWEKNHRTPAVRFYPPIMDFLSYCPLLETASSLGQHIVLHRTHRGLSQRELGRLVGADPGTVSRWETDEAKPRRATADRLRQLFGRWADPAGSD